MADIDPVERQGQIFTTTTVFQSVKVKEGEWKITEVKSDPPIDHDLHSASRKELNFGLAFGIGIGGYYDVEDKEISVTPTFGGSPIGSRYTAGLDHGVSFGIDVWAAKGSIRIYGENNQLKLEYKLGAVFLGEKSDNFVVLNL